MVKKLRKYYSRRTKPGWKQFGDALYITFGSTGIGTSIADHKWIGITFFALGMLGKFIATWFGKEE